MNMFRVMLVSLFAVSSLSYGASVSNADKAKATAKLLGAGFVAGCATIGVDKLSPEVSKAAILATLGVTTLVAARVICGGDINTANKAISLPIAGQYLPELNWFNAIAFGFGLAGYGLYKNSDKLAAALNAILATAANPV